MVHKVKTETDEMDEWIKDMDRQQDAYVKSLEADMKRQEEQYARDIKEMEATAIATYETVKAVGEKAKKGVAVAKVKAEEIKRGAKEIFGKLKGAPAGVKWYQREPVRIYVSPEIQKKREKEEKEFVTYGS
jgi:hypothetical protein